jgi:hypothetical protein
MVSSLGTFLKQKCIFAVGYFWSLTATTKQLYSFFLVLTEQLSKISQNVHILERRKEFDKYRP